MVRALGLPYGEIGELTKKIKVKEQVLDEQRREYQRLFESVPCLITVQNEALELVQFNREFGERFHPRIGGFMLLRIQKQVRTLRQLSCLGDIPGRQTP